MYYILYIYYLWFISVNFINLYFFSLVFLLYYVWGFFMYFFFTFKNIIESIYFFFNKRILFLKRDFDDLTYFEKLFLVFFNKGDIFKKSIGNLYSNNKLFDYRKNKYPLIFFFHLYYDRVNYKFYWLKILIKFYKYFYKSKYFRFVFIKFKKLFFKKINNNFLIFLILQKILFKRYYNLCNSIFFKKLDKNNLVKLNLLFYIFMLNSKGKYILYDLSKYSDWYDYNFKIKGLKKLKKINLPISYKKIVNFYRSERKKQYTKIYKFYNNFYLKLYIKLNRLYKNIFCLNLKINIFKFKFNKTWKQKLVDFYPIRYNESSVSKYINLKNINSYLFFYIRKNRIFNKGRYSRNRQLYRTGVYWCLWLNIILVYGLYFLFYRFTFNFGYFWWGILVLAYSTIFSRVIKYNFHNIYYIANEFFKLLIWIGFLSLNFKANIISFLKIIFNLIKNNSVLVKLYDYIYEIVHYKSPNIFFEWESIYHSDKSFMKYKSILHWFKQVHKLIILVANN